VRLAVVIVAFRSGASLPALLDALAPELDADDQVIVVDNDCPEGSGTAVAGHPAVTRVVATGANLGFAGGCNRGAAAAGATDALVFLNPDCLPEPGLLEELRRPPSGWSAWMGMVVLPDGETVNTAGGVAHYLGLAWSGRFGRPVAEIPSEPAPVGFLSGACMAVRREAFDEVGGFAEGFFMYVEDVDLSHRLRLAGHAFGLLPAARVRHDYAFAKGAAKWRLLERNRWLTIVRTYPLPLLLAVLPALLVLEPVLLAVAARGGWLGSKLAATLGLLRMLPAALAERRRIQGGRRIGTRAFASALTAELDSPFLGGLGRAAPARAATAAYWGAVRGALALGGGRR
jgi:N-acetylglucosaminyl-diphospho-decaprenol L-rhamnosyltransferase